MRKGGANSISGPPVMNGYANGPISGASSTVPSRGNAAAMSQTTIQPKKSGGMANHTPQLTK